MAFNKIEIHSHDFEKSLELLKKDCPNNKEFLSISKHLEELGLGKITGKPIGKNRLCKIIAMILVYYRNSDKPLRSATKESLTDFKKRLMNDEIKKLNGNPFSDETKSDLTEILVRLLEWLNFDKVTSWTENRIPFRKWFIITPSKKTVEFLSEEEVRLLYEKAKSLEGKFMIAVLFDSGARIEEFLNIRFEDIEAPTVNNPYYRIDLKDEYSKTNGRKINLYWEHSTEAISKYLQTLQDKAPNKQIITTNYDAVRMYLSRLGKKVLHKRVYPHILRKSSATHYADKLNRQQLCLRFGWAFSSLMPDTYISRAGLDEEKIKAVMFNDDLNKMKAENQSFKARIEEQQKEIQNIKEENQATKGMLKLIVGALEGKVSEEELGRVVDALEKTNK